MSTLRDAARRRLELNPITTSLNHGHLQSHHLQTPSSALSNNSLSAPFGYNPSAFTPVSAARQYNPQQWTASPSVTPDNGSQFTTHRQQDLGVTVPAPPPYSPPRSNRTSMIIGEEIVSGISPATRVSPAAQYRSSPELSSNPIFPPPPPPSSRIRAGSNDRQASVFNLSSFARRLTPDLPRLAPPELRDHGPVRQHHLPITVDILSPEGEGPQYEARPPASRRAVSAGAISTPSSSRSRGSSTTRWEPGMPLPPPPPGLPPQSRSQSMSRSSDPVQSPPTRRPGPMSSLGPVPPTPAGWVDEDLAVPAVSSQKAKSPLGQLHIDTASVGSSTVGPDSHSGSSSSGLARNRVGRGEAKSIRERRSESKPRRNPEYVEEPSNNPWAESITPSDILVPMSGLTRRPTINRSTPRSGRSYQLEIPGSADSSHQSTPLQGSGSRGSTPRPLLSARQSGAATPPFSPNTNGQIRPQYISSSPSLPPKALPTPPSQSRMIMASPASRPVASILHTPNNDVGTTIGPLSASRTSSRQSIESHVSQLSPSDQFASDANERHQTFSQKEASASTDSERVRLFAEFIVTESRLRRERYSTAIDGMGSEILELTRDLFRPYSGPRRESSVSRSNGWTPETSAGPAPFQKSSGWTPESSTGPRSPINTGPRSHRGSLTAALRDTPQLQTQPSSEPTSGSGPASPASGRPDPSWWTAYMPSLSPIPSMSVSEALDGSDSRGRPSSRWWELSNEGGSNGTPSIRLERSKRESKYMGMPKELREALQYANGASLTKPNGKDVDSGDGTCDDEYFYGPNEYPPEKSSWNKHDPSSPPPLQTSPKSPGTFSPMPSTPNPAHLDISRLITLPPPFPRHHPAVNNNHPDLTAIRTTIRQLSDFTAVETAKSRFIKASTQLSLEEEAAASQRRNSMRSDIQRSIQSGAMTYAAAAQAEAEFTSTEAEKTKEASKLSFELFQAQVVIPLNDLLMDRVHRSTELFTQLRSKLFVDAQEQSHNLTQEEGDEQPELLEKLTLLKWIFETRESLHRELFDLLSDRNNRYKEMVITPYRLASNAAKIANAESFFAEDAGKRKLAFEQDILKRTEEFMDIIEENVVRGVEVQLSAFWDIAPNLRSITDKVPLSPKLGSFYIQIPSSEYDENPSYYEHPLQYLYSLMRHCEKSTYQFIESQTNLLCLLHEVKSIVTFANCRLMRTQRVQQGEREDIVNAELEAVKKDEGIRLTDDLKEKVRCVEELWCSALGEELSGVKERIARFLVEGGGWEDDD